MAEVARRLPSQSAASARSYSQSPQKSKHHRSASQGNSRSDADHKRSMSSSSSFKAKANPSQSPSSSLPTSPSSERKKLQSQILTNGSSDHLQETLKQKGMLHALLSDPVKFVKSNDKQVQDYTSMHLTPVNDPDFAASQQRKAEQQRHTLNFNDDGSSKTGTSTQDAEAGPSSPSKASANTATRDLYPYKISLQFPGKVRPTATGLSNYGNTCYMNSVMQSLIHTPPLTSAMLTQELGTLQGVWGGKPGHFDAVTAMQAFTKRTMQGTRSTNAPQEFNRNLKAYAKPLRPGRQEDAHEYLRFLLEAMQQSCLTKAPKSLKPDDAVRRSTFVQKIFGGVLRSRVTCHKCGHNSDTFDPFMDLSLDVRKGIDSLADAFRAFVAKDKLSGSEKYKCEKCKRKVDATKQFTIDSPPPALTIHLKRFTAFGGKVSRPIAFDESINIDPYLSVSKGSARYRLYAVVHHFGSGPNSGHYVASVRSPSGKWNRMDDSYVSEMSKSAPTNESSAYILFYLREKEEALERAISSNLTTSSKLSGFVKSGLKGLMNGSPLKSAKRKAEPAQESDSSMSSDEEADAPLSPKKAAKLPRLEQSRSSLPHSAPSARSMPSPSSSAQVNGLTKKRSYHSDSDTISQHSGEEDNDLQAGEQSRQKLMNGSSQKLDRALSVKPLSAVSFYGNKSGGSSKSAAFDLPDEQDSEELGEAVQRDEYESLVISPRPPLLSKRVADQEDASDDADLSRQSTVSNSSPSKKERRKQRRAEAARVAKSGRGIPSSPYANAFHSSPKKQKKAKRLSDSITGNFAGRMKPRPSLP